MLVELLVKIGGIIWAVLERIGYVIFDFIEAVLNGIYYARYIIMPLLLLLAILSVIEVSDPVLERIIVTDEQGVVIKEYKNVKAKNGEITIILEGDGFNGKR